LLNSKDLRAYYRKITPPGNIGESPVNQRNRI
jgi:hypothetical protein